jgi:hypothetical protein
MNATGTQRAETDFAKVPVFVVNGLRPTEKVATSSMIVHELYLDRPGADAAGARHIVASLSDRHRRAA